MTEYICLLDFLNLFLLLAGTPGELHVRLSKDRSHLVPPYRASPPRLLPGRLPAHQLLQAHLLVYLVQEIFHGIFRISTKVIFVDASPAVQKRPSRRGHPTHVVGMRHVHYGGIALPSAPIEFVGGVAGWGQDGVQFCFGLENLGAACTFAGCHSH